MMIAELKSDSIPRTQIKVASSQSTAIAGEPTEVAKTLSIECTYVTYINQEHKIYRTDVIKRLSSAQVVDPFDASFDDYLFGEEDITVLCVAYSGVIVFIIFLSGEVASNKMCGLRS